MAHEDDYEVVWNGRGAMPHEERDREYFQIRDETTWRFAPNPKEFVTTAESDRVTFPGHQWHHDTVGTGTSSLHQDRKCVCACGRKKRKGASMCAACLRPNAAIRTRLRCSSCGQLKLKAEVRRRGGRRLCLGCRALAQC